MATDCEVKVYDYIDQGKIKTIIAELQGQGATIAGDNPWQADMHKGGVVLGGSWDQGASRLTITILAKSMLASCNAVWEAVDPQMKTVQARPNAAVSTSGQGDAGILKILETSGTPLSATDRATFKSALDKLDTLAAPPAVAPPVASASAAVSDSSNTALYVIGGALVIGAAYLMFRKKS